MKRLVIVLCVVVLLTLAGVAIRQATPIRERYYTDADTIRTPVDQARLRDILWQPPRPLPDVINLSDTDVYEPRLSGDGLTIYFVKGKAGEGSDIYVARRTYEGWSAAEPLVAVNSEYEDLGPEPTPNGSALYFYSDRPGGAGGYDLWVSYRSGDGRSDAAWLAPVNLGPNVNSEFNDYGPAVTPDGTMLYYASNRPQPGDTRQPNPNAWPATLREDLFQRTYDLYVSVLTDSGPASSEPLAVLNTPYNEGAPAVSVFGDFLYFASDRPGGEGGFDLYRARRVRELLDSAENLGGTVNTRANELDPGLSLGGFRLFFSSDRGEHVSDSEPPPEPRRYALYHTTSREVFRDVESHRRAGIDWGGLWSAVGPGLIWLLLALLALLALLWFMRGLQERDVSLLTKCLLTSLLLHLLLLLLFSLWHVTASIAGEFRRGGRIQVALAPQGSSHDLARQVLGAVTEVDGPESVEVEPIRGKSRLPLRTEAQLTSLTVERVSLEGSERISHTDTIAEARPSSSRRDAPDAVQQPVPEEPIALAVSLPSLPESRRVDAAEPAEESPNPSEMTNHLPRNKSLPSRAAQEPPRHVVLPAAPGVLEDSNTSADTSLAADTPPRDAARETHARAMDVRALMPAVSKPPPSPEVRLALDVGRSVPLDGEPGVVVEPVVVRIARAPARETVSRSEFASGGVRTHPEASAVMTDEPTTLIESTKIAEAAEVGAVMPSASGQPIPQQSHRDVELTALAIPQEESRSLLNEEAPSEYPIDTGTKLATRATSPPRAASAPGETESAIRAVEIKPDMMRFGESPTLVGIEAEQVDDAAPAEVVRRKVEAPPVQSAIKTPTPVAVALPGELARVDVAEQLEADSADLPEKRPSAVRVDAQIFPAPYVPSYDAGIPDRFAMRDTDGTFRSDQPLLQDAAVAGTLLSLSDLTEPVKSATLELNPQIRLPRDEAQPENPYAQRESPHRLALVERSGGSRETEEAVERALAWLARHQSADGRWDANGFDDGCDACGGETDIAADVALTGLSTLCFLGAGHTHVKDGPYRDHVDRALRWLREQQSSDGDLRGDETMYTHGIATIALSEARSMSGDTGLTESVERAIRFIYRSRNRSEGGWRYDPGQPGDTSVLGWQMMALKSAAMSGMAVPGEAFDVARRWLERVDGGPALGLYAYMPGRPFTPSMTAEGMFVRQLIGHGPDEPPMRASAEFVLEHLPDWDADPNTYFWYYASLALFQHGGPAWETWNEALTRELLEHQRRDGGADGSWDPEGEWAELGGRVYQTALCTLMLEVYYRYLPLYSAEAVRPVALPVDAIGAIRGSISDADSGAPLEDASVRLVIADGEPIIARSDRNGDYTMFVPEMPDYFALSSSMEGYVPLSQNVDTRAVEGGLLRVNFELDRLGDDVLVLEPVPDVHHLGDDRFGGRINSQFQKASEGAQFEQEFSVTEATRSRGISRAEVQMLVKGVQRRHRIVINGETLEDRLDNAPSDGSFGEFRASFDPSLLRAGTNTLAIIARPSSSDIDDFEFVNVQIILIP